MKQGRLTQWDEAKGYGFITPDDGGPRLFVHIEAFGRRLQRPVAGERLRYREGLDAQGKRRALDARCLNKPAPVQPAARDGGRVLLLVPAFASFVLFCHVMWPLPHGLWGLYVAMSMATFITYALDKRAARRGGWRVPEATLHGLVLVCGWPGALLAQELLRHKTAKASFRRRFWAMVALNLAAFVALFTPLFRS